MAVIVSWHPTFAFFRAPTEWGAFNGDLDRFARLIRGKTEPGPRAILTRPSAKHVRQLHKWARRTGEPVSFDIETKPSNSEKPWTGKDPTRALLDLMGLGNTEVGLSIKWKKATVGTKLAVKRLLEDPKVVKDAQNADWFDNRVLERYGIRVQNVFDCRDARRALSATSRLSLGYMTSIYCDAHPWKEKDSDEEKGALWQKPEYNAYDCVYTSRVARGIRSEPQWGTGRVQTLYEVHRKLARIAAKMHSHGFLVDRTMRRWMAWALAEEFNEQVFALREAVGIDGFDANPNHLRALLFRKHAVGKNARFARFNLPDPIDPALYVDPKEPDTVSVNEDTLTLLLIDPDIPDDLKHIINLYWDATSTWKRRSVFVTSALVSHAIGKDGRLRAGWNSCGTDTGRFSCSEPNLMNIEQQMRSMYIASPGYVLIGADFSQLELRVMAAVAQDRALRNALETGDVYSFDAKAWFGLPAEMDVKKLKPGARKASKIIHLASQYGAGTKTIHQQALKQDRSMTWALTQGLHDGFKKTYCDTTRYWQEEHQRVCSTGYSASRIMDRRRYYPREPPITETANFPIQSTAADIANLSLIELDEGLDRHFPSARLLLQLHDAFYVEARIEDERGVRELLAECMERPRTIEGKQYVFPTEIKASDRWNDL